jgi:hypothetical protein
MLVPEWKIRCSSTKKSAMDLFAKVAAVSFGFMAT